MPLRPIPRPRVVRPGRPSGHFTQHRRLDKMRETLEAHPDGLPLDELATVLHCTTRSVRRYLHELSLLVELESVPTAPGGAHVWRIKPSERGRTVALRRTQAYGLLAARKVFEVLKGSALYDELDVTWREIAQVAHRPTRGAKGEAPADRRLEDRFLYLPSPPRNYAARAEELDDLFQAVAELRVVRFHYRIEARGERVIAHPYAMVLHKGRIACVAKDVEQDALRAFAFEKMTHLEPSAEERFALPNDFDLEELVHGEFGVALPGDSKAVRVVVEFDPRHAEEVRAQRVHPSQRIATAPDGRVRISFAVPELHAVKEWVLGFGAGARVIEPPELAIDVIRELRRAIARYGQ